MEPDWAQKDEEMLDADECTPSLEELDNFLRLSWERLVLSMIPTANSSVTRPKAVEHLLVQSGLMAKYY